MPYSIRVALQSLRHEPWINILSMVTMAMGLLVVTIVVLFVYNVNLFTKRLPERFSVIAYLKDSVAEPEARVLANSLASRKDVSNVKYISKADAMKELRSTLKDAEFILEGLNENPLPASFEIRLKREAVGPEGVKALVADLRKISGIEDVHYGERFLISLHSIKLGVQTIGLALTVSMIAGVIFICFSAVKILFYRRREEIETLKLLGATKTFIRQPFLVEGGLIGLVGGISGLIVIMMVYTYVLKKLSVIAPLLNVVVFPAETVVALPLAGLLFGIAGAFIAIGRIKL